MWKQCGAVLLRQRLYPQIWWPCWLWAGWACHHEQQVFPTVFVNEYHTDIQLLTVTDNKDKYGNQKFDEKLKICPT